MSPSKKEKPSRSMALAFLGLNEDPFAHLSSPHLYYVSRYIRTMIVAFRDAVDRAAPAVFISGAEGSGRTALLRFLYSELFADPDHFTTYYLNVRAGMSEVEIVTDLSIKLGVEKRRKVLSSQYTALEETIKQNHGEAQRIVLFFDDAQNLSDEALTILSDLLKMQRRSVGIVPVLAGNATLMSRFLEALGDDYPFEEAQQFNIPDFTLTDTIGMIDHRCFVAGRQTKLFNESSIVAIHQAANRNPKTINQICSNIIDRVANIENASKSEPIPEELVVEVISRWANKDQEK